VKDDPRMKRLIGTSNTNNIGSVNSCEMTFKPRRKKMLRKNVCFADKAKVTKNPTTER
jgi:hypothetical protein